MNKTNLVARSSTTLLLTACFLLGIFGPNSGTPFASNLLADTVVVASSGTVVVQDDQGKVLAVLDLQIVGGEIQVKSLPFRTVGGQSNSPVIPVAPTPSLPENLAGWVRETVNRIPEGERKNDTKTALAAVFKTLADAVNQGSFGDPNGNFNVPEMQRVLNESLDKILRTLGTEKDWKPWTKNLANELTRRKIGPDKVAGAFDEISQGLSHGQAVKPELIAIALELVNAVITKNKEAMIAAVGKLIATLIAG